MSANCIQQQNQFKQLINEDYINDNQDQSTTNQSKQSNATLTNTFAYPDCNFKNKPIKTQRSLLSLTPQISQRKGSRSLIEQTITIEEEPFFQNGKEIYTIYWYDETIEHKYEIRIEANNSLTIGDLIELAVQQFNKETEYIQTPFSSDVAMNNIYELYYPKKKKGTPNEDYPSFSNSTLLSKTNQTEFSLKVTVKKQTKYSTSLSNSKRSSEIKKNQQKQQSQHNSSQKKKNFFQQLFFCCNTTEEY